VDLEANPKDKVSYREVTLRSDSLHRDARRIFTAALNAVDAGKLVEDSLEISKDVIRVGGASLPALSPAGRVFVFGAGKAVAVMAKAVERKLGTLISGGMVITKSGHSMPLKRVVCFEGTHPQPSERNIQFTRKLLVDLSLAGPEDRILFVWSGGASALLFLPRPGISAPEKTDAVSRLMDAGADIRELNTVRKHLSAIKGGQLARVACATPSASLIISDVCGDNPATIGSGPTFPDDSSFADAIEVLKHYRLWKSVSATIRTLLTAGARGKIPENPRRRDASFRGKKTILLGTSREAVEAAFRAARALGYQTLVLAQQLQGDTEAAAQLHVTTAAAWRKRNPLAIISGGETTVRLAAGHGMGGRNQHFTLAAALLMERRPEFRGRRYTVLSAGTDGTDGPTEAAGAVADQTTIQRAKARAMDGEAFLRRQDSYSFFKKLDDLIVTGPTNTNVMDLRILLLS
jgi:hydroxypyruvate reductase